MELNWKEFMRKQDMIWKIPPRSWQEGAFLGNGRCGLLVYQDPGNQKLTLELGRSDVYDNRDMDGGMEAMYSCPRLPIGKLYLNLKGSIQDFFMRLDLLHATLNGTVKTDRGQISFQMFVHALEMISLVKIQEEGEETAEWEMQPALSQSPRQKFGLDHNDPKRLKEGYKANPMAKIRCQEDRIAVLQELSRGAGYLTGYVCKRKGREHILYLQVNTGDCLEQAWRETMNCLKEKSECGTAFEEMKTSHDTWWEEYFSLSFVSLPDKKMESFYWAQLYKAASATRSEHLVMDNQGPWLVDTCWPGTWWNLNVQLAYSPLYTANRLSVSESLWKNLQLHLDELVQNVPEKCRVDSAGIHTATGRTFLSPVPEPGPQNGPEVFTELGNLTWALYDCYLYYRMNMDDSFLKDFLYPMLRRSINFYLHYLTKREDGKWHLAQTSSPEYHQNCEDCNYDLSLLNWGIKTLIWITDRLSIQDPLYEKWKDVEENITEYPQDEDGLYIGKGVKYLHSHRHYSHLLMIYPLHLINAEQGEEEKDLILRSLAWWQSMPEQLQGYSYTGAASICAGLGDGDRALQYLEQLWGNFLKPNTMYAESGPVIETPLAAAQVLNEMMLQSWGDKVRVFPAMPSSWEEAAFRDLCAEGGFLVSARRKGGKTVWVRITSKAGEPLVISADFQEVEAEGSSARVEKIGEQEWRVVNLKKGEQIVLFEKGTKNPEDLTPCHYTKHADYYYGLQAEEAR